MVLVLCLLYCRLAKAGVQPLPQCAKCIDRICLLHFAVRQHFWAEEIYSSLATDSHVSVQALQKLKFQHQMWMFQP